MNNESQSFEFQRDKISRLFIKSTFALTAAIPGCCLDVGKEGIIKVLCCF